MIRARVQHTYNHKSGLPEHGVVNTFYFHHELMSAGELDTTEATALAQIVIGFYDTAFSGGVAPRAHLAETSLAVQRHTVKVYDLADDEPRAPKVTFTPGAPATANSGLPYPAEIALCLSYRGALESGTNAARRRGRIYIGPVADAGVDLTDAAGFNRPSAAFRTSLVNAAQGLKTTAAASGWVWCVRSGGGGGGDFDFPDVFTPIQYAWCDDAWDTQRRRGANPLVRTAQDLGPVTIPFDQN